MRISDWSSDVCSSDLRRQQQGVGEHVVETATVTADHDDPPRLVLHRGVERQLEVGRVLGLGVTLHHGAVGAHQREGALGHGVKVADRERSEEHTSELQSLMRISYAVFCLKKKTRSNNRKQTHI